MKKTSLFALIVVSALSKTGSAQNTGGVFSPVVNAHHSAIQYRSAYDIQADGFAQRLHYEESLNGNLMWRAVLGSHKTTRSDFDFDFFQAELFWELSDGNDPIKTGLRFDLHLRDRDRPHFFGVNWMSQFNLSDDWSCRFVAMSTIDFGENVNHGVFFQTRASITYHVNERLSLGAEFYDSLGSTDELLGFADQTNQIGPVASYSFNNDFSVYGGVLYGLSENSPDSQVRLWLTRTF